MVDSPLFKYIEHSTKSSNRWFHVHGYNTNSIIPVYLLIETVFININFVINRYCLIIINHVFSKQSRVNFYDFVIFSVFIIIFAINGRRLFLFLFRFVICTFHCCVYVNHIILRFDFFYRHFLQGVYFRGRN
ncbi:hypothetical protein D3C71_1217050 [compost metagenome]